MELAVKDGGFSARQAEVLSRLYMLEGRLEHASPDIDAEEVREAVEALRRELPGLIESAVAWLRRYGVTFGPSRAA